MDVYLLSILDQLCKMSQAFVFVAAVATILSGLFLGFAHTETDDAAMHKTSRKWFGVSLALLFLCIIGTGLVPKKRDLVEAYLILEGAEIAKAENVEIAIEWADKKLDKWIDAQAKDEQAKD